MFIEVDMQFMYRKFLSIRVNAHLIVVFPFFDRLVIQVKNISKYC